MGEQVGHMADEGLKRINRDTIVFAVAIAACVLFVGAAGTSVNQTIRALMGFGERPNPLLACATLLNIALILFSWRRCRDLAKETHRRQEAQTEVRILSLTDPLTGCHNRRSIGTIAASMREQAEQRGQRIATLLFDIDRFKQVNDINGQKVGDALLVEVARRVSAVIPVEAKLARLGGDEFCCFVPFNPKQRDWVDMIAANILQAIAKPILIDGIMIEVTASVGISHPDGDNATVDDRAIHEADIAMHHTKKSGRGLYDWFTPAMENELRFRNELETGIRKGIQSGEFVPYYQKQIDLESGELVGFEMLARWHSDTLGEIAPDMFIPIAEEIGLIADLSEALIRRALQDAKQWDPRLILSVNIFPVQLRDPWFSQKLLLLLVDEGFPAERLEIEITESCLHENIGSVRAMIASLKSQGIRVSLDDFGTGYSSLAYLKKLAIHRLKIDRTFICGLPDDEGDSAIVKAVLGMGRALGFSVVAEGVETQGQRDVLLRLGCDELQGFFYARPMRAHAVLGWSLDEAAGLAPAS